MLDEDILFFSFVTLLLPITGFGSFFFRNENILFFFLCIEVSSSTEPAEVVLWAEESVYFRASALFKRTFGLYNLLEGGEGFGSSFKNGALCVVLSVSELMIVFSSRLTGKLLSRSRIVRCVLTLLRGP